MEQEGNIGAGKWNDGSHENRQVLADKVSVGMQKAWTNQKVSPLNSGDISWASQTVALPIGNHLQPEPLTAILQNPDAKGPERLTAAKHLAFLQRSEAEQHINIGCLSIGDARIIHMPGELFVEYQLAAQKLRPDLLVAMAAYGDYGPGYIGTEIAYSQGGYETSERASRVSPGVEKVLLDAMEMLLIK